jgi:DNA-directed RNA polymerase subunit E'/Rpb7
MYNIMNSVASVEPVAVKNVFKKRIDAKYQTIYSRCLLTRKLVLPIACIGKNLDQVIDEKIRNDFEGKCVVEGYIKQGSSKIISYSSGVVERGNTVVFVVVFECNVCFPVEGMLISCIVKNVVKSGIRAESSTEVPSPVVVFVAKDHHFNIQHFNDIKEGDTINVRVIGQRFELNDKFVSIIGQYVKEKDHFAKQPTKAVLKPPRIVIEN